MMHAELTTEAPPGMTSGPREYIHRVDATDRIIAVNPDWLTFAQENAAPVGTLDAVGTSLWTHIAGTEVQYLYQQLLRAVRGHRRMVRFPFRCDTPTLQRMMQMTMVRQPDQEVEFRSRVLHQHPTAFVVLFDAVARRSNTLLCMCSWCRQVRLSSETGPDEWVEPQVAIARLDLFADGPVPRITHSSCPSCEQRILGAAGLTGRH
jgi:hypothetical protein